MARVLLANAYFYRLDPKQWRDARPHPPLGTIQAAAVLHDAGHEVHLFDACLRRSPDELAGVLDRVKPEVLAIHDDGFNYLTKMCLTVMREAAFRMARLGKEAGCFVTINSSDSTDHAEDYLRAGCDVVIRGEGEITLREVIAAGPTGDHAAIAGLTLPRDGVPFATPSRPVLRDLDALPLPAWDLVDARPYRAIWEKSQGHFGLNVATTRGCPFKCNWCAKPIYGNRYNVRSPAHVVRELVMLRDRFAPDRLWMCDDIFGLKPGWVQAFRDEVKRAGLKLRFKIQSRADLLLEGDTIDALVESGLHEVWIGAESGSQKILDAMEKGITVEQIAEAAHLLKARGVRVGFFLQFGYLGETDADIDATIAMLERLRPDDIGISVSYPLPGTKFFERVRGDLGHKANWTDSDDLAMMFRQQHRPEFYKRLHRYVHKRFRRGQALGEWRKAIRGDRADLRRALTAAWYLPAERIDRHRLDRLRT